MTCQKCQLLSQTVTYEMKAPGLEVGKISITGCEFHNRMAIDKLDQFDRSMMKIAETYSAKIHDLEHKLEAKQKEYDNILFRLRHQQSRGYTFDK